MTVKKLVVIAVVVVAAIGGFLYWKGGLKVGEGGKVEIDMSKIEAPEMSPYTKGQSLYSVFKYEDALAEFRRGLKEDPKDSYAPMARYRIAECLKKLDKPKESLRAYRTFLKKHPDHKQAGQARKYIEVLRGSE